MRTCARVAGTISIALTVSCTGAAHAQLSGRPFGDDTYVHYDGAPHGRCPDLVTSPESERLALVLSGGGARGLAHIGILRVLDSLGVRPSMVVGTSMGALVGALYAGGMSGRDIDSLARGLPFQMLFRRYTPIVSLTEGDFGAPVTIMPPTFVLEISNGRFRVQSPVAREPQINALFNELLLRPNLVAAGDFDRLPISFRAVATDVRTRSTVVLGRGDLAEAVRASIAIPVVFSPVALRQQLLVDGGLTANVPVQVARQNGATSVIVSDVGSSAPDSIDATSTTSMLAYVIDELFTQPLDSLGPSDLAIRPPVRAFRALEFTEGVVGPLIDSGYHAAADVFPNCPPADIRRQAVQQPPPGSELGIVRQRLDLLAEQNAYESVWLRPSLSPRLGRDTGTATLRFDPVAVPAPERMASIGVGYDGHEGGRLWMAAMNLTAPGGRVRVSSSLSIGEWRQRLVLGITGLRRHPLPHGTADSLTSPQVPLPDPRSDQPPWSTLASSLPRPELSITLTNETVRLYNQRGRENAQPRTRDLVVFGGFSRAFSTGQRIAIGPVAHLWSARGTESPDEGDQALGAMARALHTLPAPAGGPDPNRVPYVALEAMWLNEYHRVHGQAELEFHLGKLILRPRGAGGWSDGLPLGAQFVLGAPRDFPGLRPGERRGDRYAFGSLALIRRVAGPLFGRLEAGGGRTSFVEPLEAGVVDDAGQGWVRGIDIGLVTDTPLGPISLAYGLSSTDRSVLKVRFGY